ncbi:uncharacterized protein LOC117290667 [Asterias rubens]|uniref:uncharacterized protein LOC117290667 n=1 Tax=Asterias rubens TaxID=7604 RepID=UPI001455BC02|nr:uncharacterized protein LOC117290667 [Asterias rubens]
MRWCAVLAVSVLILAQGGATPSYLPEWIHNGTCPEMTHPVFDDVIGAVPCPLSCNSILVDNDCDVTEKCCRTPCNPNSWKCITPL